MQLPTQEQFVKDCLSKYRWEQIPTDQKWEAAHFPLPACSGEGDTVQLWSADHTVQGLLQSVELNHQCFHGFRNKHDTDLLTSHYPEYLELFKQLKFKFNSRQGKKAVINKMGIHAPGMQSAGGKKAAITNQANRTSIFAPGMQSAGSATTNAQKWQCLVTGHISNSGGLSNYQKARGISTCSRIKLVDQLSRL